MDWHYILTVMVSALVTGAVSSVATVRALKVHIEYLRETAQRQENAIIEAYARIAAIERFCPVLHEKKL